MALQRDLTLELALGLRELMQTSVLRGLLHALRQRLRAAYATLRQPAVFQTFLIWACARLASSLRDPCADAMPLTPNLRAACATLRIQCVSIVPNSFYEILSEFCLRK